jgi:hypothetical protein
MTSDSILLGRAMRWDVNLHAPRARLPASRMAPRPTSAGINDEGKLVHFDVLLVHVVMSNLAIIVSTGNT